jgi:hypothetical protein
VPALVVESEQDLRSLGHRQVRFGQTHRSIPVFGSAAVVELTAGRELVSVSAQLDEVTGVDPVESLSRADALARVEEYTGAGIPAETGVGGGLTFYKDVGTDGEPERWHLAWLFPGLPAAPPAGGTQTPDDDALDGHGLGRRPVPVSFTYLVDAHDGAILYHYSAVPTPCRPRPAARASTRTRPSRCSSASWSPPAPPAGWPTRCGRPHLRPAVRRHRLRPAAARARGRGRHQRLRHDQPGGRLRARQRVPGAGLLQGRPAARRHRRPGHGADHPR